jgi:CBS domain-containing protein
MKVSDIMKQPVVTVRDTDTLEAVAQTMLDHKVWGVPVVNAQGELCGIITDGDFAAQEAWVPFTRLRAPQLFRQWIESEQLESLYEKARTMKAADIMSSPVITVTEDESVDAVVNLMLKRHITRIPVVRGKIPVGMVARNDLLKLMARHLDPASEVILPIDPLQILPGDV